MSRVPDVRLTEGRQGHYAGAVSRLAAFVLDVGASWGLFTLGVAVVTFAVNLVARTSLSTRSYGVISVVLYLVWGFVYFAYQWSLGGRTIGMAVLGIQVVRADGSPLRARDAVMRTLVFPLSFVAFGLGFLGILVHRERRAWHDRLAGTAVVYSWDARAARLRWLAKREPGSRTA